MSPTDLKKAYRLWKQFKVSTQAYQAIANKYGMQLIELSSICSRHNFYLNQQKGANR